MKAATGELSLTLITVVAIGAVLAFFWALWPSIKEEVIGTVDDWATEEKTYNSQENEYTYADYVYENMM